MQDRVLFLVLRRMRLPLLVLIGAYSVAILGLTLVPGVDAAGHPHHLDFFHAFYVISYTVTTIGFGELPYPFTDAQRLWLLFSIYTGVIAWFYAIGTLIALLQDPAFRLLIRAARFGAHVRRLTEPFHVICGYGDTGNLIVQSMARRGMAIVVIDRDPERINELSLENLGLAVPALCADASQPASLLLAGLKHPMCAGVVAVTPDDQVNLRIAIAGKLLKPSLKVISRAQSRDTQANMASFGTDAVANPFDTFADRLASALHSPDLHLLYQWLTARSGEPLPPRLDPPRGTWILCGYGRFGKAVDRYLQYEGVPTVIIEKEPDRTEAPEGTVVGRGTEAVTLREAHIESVVGIVAGTDDDANNLSIIVTARELNPALFTVARQNERENAPLFHAAALDLVMERASMLAARILTLIRTPMLAEFLRLARHQNNEWAAMLVERLGHVVRGRTPDVWAVEIRAPRAAAVTGALSEGAEVRVAHLLADPGDRDRSLPCIALLHLRGEEETLLPDEPLALQEGDRLLFCGHPEARARMFRILRDRNVLGYVQSGVLHPDGYVWRWWARRNG